MKTTFLQVAVSAAAAILFAEVSIALPHEHSPRTDTELAERAPPSLPGYLPCPPNCDPNTPPPDTASEKSIHIEKREEDEKWDSTSRDNAVTQRKRIFRDYVQLGVYGLWPYHEQAKAGNYSPPTASQIESILKAVRTPQQRAVASSLVRGDEREWLRIDYGAGENPLDTVEDFLPMALSNRAQNTSALILNDSNLYNYDDWPEILECFPEVLDSCVGPPNPESHRRIAEEKESAENDMDV
ncbi:hypothetical protein VTN00DRAFT_2424 [Thermoascus crustaceus]|uniref:uncharacterized protein n=1 Tax=Thermoascus crustaceus TaxID=5088 RepID=UPI0037431A87